MLTRMDFETAARALCAAGGLNADEMVVETVQEKLQGVFNSNAYVVEPGPRMPRWMFRADDLLKFAATSPGDDTGTATPT